MKALNHIALAGLLAVAPATGLTLAERALPQRAAATAEQRRRQLDAGPYTYRSSRRRGPGWTVAQVRRMARKRRNQLRHRAACKAAGGKGRRSC
jgi:hypothetical protein